MQPMDNLLREFRPLAECPDPDDYSGSLCYDVGGYVLGDPLDTMLRVLSVDYLASAWERLQPILRRHEIEPDDLSWGWLFPGETQIAGLEKLAPSHYTGWITQDLDLFDFNVKHDDSPRHVQIRDELKGGQPSLNYAYVWRRSAKWRIAPDDFPLALRLIEALWSDEVVDWAPQVVLGVHERLRELLRKESEAFLERRQSDYELYQAQLREVADDPEFWLPDHIPAAELRKQVALAIATGNQQHLERALADSQTAYSPSGYRILVRGFERYLSQFDQDHVHVHIP